MYEWTHAANQRFKITYDPVDGCYYITNVRSGLVLDVSGGVTTGNPQVIQWTKNGGDNQKWILVMDRPPYVSSIVSIAPKLDTSLRLTVAGSIFENAKPIQLRPSNITDAGQSLFLMGAAERPIADGVYTIRCYGAGGNLVDVTGSGTANGTNIETWIPNGGTNQKFRVKYDIATGYYTIATSLNASLLLDENGSTFNVALWGLNGGFNQFWHFQSVNYGSDNVRVYAIYSAKSGRALDATGNNSAAGTNIITWPYNNNAGPNQHWLFTKVG